MKSLTFKNYIDLLQYYSYLTTMSALLMVLNYKVFGFTAERCIGVFTVGLFINVLFVAGKGIFMWVTRNKENN